jgi:hypothetical protein
MATNPRLAKKTAAQKKRAVIWNFPLQKQNFIIIGIGLLVILIGYILMLFGVTDQPAVPDGKWNNFFSVSLAPIILVIGYCVIIPYGIIKTFKKTSE